MRVRREARLAVVVAAMRLAVYAHRAESLPVPAHVASWNLASWNLPLG